MEIDLMICAIAGGIVSGILNYPPLSQSSKYAICGALIGFFSYPLTALIPYLKDLNPEALVFLTVTFSSTLLINLSEKINKIIHQTPDKVVKKYLTKKIDTQEDKKTLDNQKALENHNKDD